MPDSEIIPDQTIGLGKAVGVLPPVSRRLAAIMLADVVGYTRLMSVDEGGTRERVAVLVIELIDSTLRDHRGRLVTKMGDGILAEFTSALDAVRCGLEIQRRLKARQDDQTEAISLRIGINTGDIIVDERDIYGHVINVAARLQSVAHPGSICVSQSIFDQTRGHPGLHFTDRGMQRLKNIGDPIRVFDVSDGQAPAIRHLHFTKRTIWRGAAIVAAMTMTGFYSGSNYNPRRENSILVLPFRNLSTVQDDDYFADAITDDITTDLSRLSSAFVISSATALTYKGRSLDARTIGKDCEVRYLLEGTIRKKAGTVQTNVQLIDAATGRSIWAERFVYDADSLLNLEKTITGRVGASLNIRESRAPSDLKGTNFTVNKQSLDERLHAMALISGPPTPEKYAQARQDVEECVRLDPSSSKCWSLLARIIMSEYLNSWNDVGLQDVERAQDAYKRTLELDPEDAGAYYAAGLVSRVRGDHERSLAELKRATALDPNLVVAHAQMANAFLFLGRIPEAIEAGKMALSLSPRDPSIGVFYWVIGRAYFVGGQYREAADWLGRSVEQRPNLWFNAAWLISARALSGEHAASRQLVEQFAQKFPTYTVARIREIYTKEPQYNNKVIVAAREHLFQGLSEAELK